MIDIFKNKQFQEIWFQSRFSCQYKNTIIIEYWNIIESFKSFYHYSDIYILLSWLEKFNIIKVKWEREDKREK